MRKALEHFPEETVSAAERLDVALRKFLARCTVGIAAVLAVDSWTLEGAVRKAVWQAWLKRAEVGVAETVDTPIADVAKDAPPSTNETIEEAADRIITGEYGIPREIWEVIIDKESGGDMLAMKFEPHLMNRVSATSQHEKRWMSTSWCAFQVLGLHINRINQKYGKRWTYQDLVFKTDVCAEAAAIVLSECFHAPAAKSSKTVRSRLNNVFVCWNGSGTYAQDAMSKVTDKMLANFAIDVKPVDKKPLPKDSLTRKDRKELNDLLAQLPEGEPFDAREVE